ncbi:hypothetical protein D3C85_1805090 [compost metagenome]
MGVNSEVRKKFCSLTPEVTRKARTKPRILIRITVARTNFTVNHSESQNLESVNTSL